MLGIITPKVQENVTAVGNVTLHVWTSNCMGQRPAAAAKALNKWDGGRAHRGEVGSPVLGSGVLPPGNL